MIKHCDNAIVDPVIALLDGELPRALKHIDLEFSEDAAAKPQFRKWQFLVERASDRGVMLTSHVLPSAPLHCNFCEQYEARTQGV